MSSDFIPPADPNDPSWGTESSIRPASRPETDGKWRLLGIIGAVVALTIALWNSFPLQPRQARGFLFAVVIVIVALIVLRVVFRSAWHTLRSRLELLVPVGVIAGVSQLIGLLSRLPLLGALFLPKWSGRLLGLTVELSLGLVLSITIWTALAAWQTDLLWRWLRRDPAWSLSPWVPVREGFWRSFVALAIGVGVLLAALVPAVAIGAVALPLALLAMGVLGAGWNLCTAALLPAVLFHPGRLREGVRTGFVLSWQRKGLWWRQLVVQLLLLGLFTFVAAHFTSATSVPGPTGTAIRTSSNTKSNTNWSVNAFWVGGYEHGCRWYTKYSDALETEPVPLISQVLALVCLVVAVAMKLTVMREIIEYLPTRNRFVENPHLDARIWS